MTAPDPLMVEAAAHRAADHARDEILDHVRRYVEALTASPDESRRRIGVELAAIVGAPC